MNIDIGVESCATFTMQVGDIISDIASYISTHQESYEKFLQSEAERNAEINRP